MVYIGNALKRKKCGEKGPLCCMVITFRNRLFFSEHLPGPGSGEERSRKRR